MSVAEKKVAMVETARRRARADALELRLLAAPDPCDVGRRDPRATRHRPQPRGAGKALDERYPHGADALAAGVVNTAQTRAIVEIPGRTPGATWRRGCS